MISIITDSCADLGPELLSRHQVHSIPLTVFINERTYHDGVDIHPQQIFEMVANGSLLPKTSAPAVGEFLSAYQEIPGEILFIGIGSRLSATVQNAILAGEQIADRRIVVIDSQNLSSGIGLLVLKAADLRDQGLSLGLIEHEIRSRIPKVHTSFVIDTLDYLYKGGRCSAMENIVGSLLKIRPVIEVRPDGSLGVKEKLRGNRKKALDTLLEAFREDAAQVDRRRVFVTHAGCDNDAQYLKEGLLQIAPLEEVLITQAGATVSSHCGPNTIGILYLTQ